MDESLVLLVQTLCTKLGVSPTSLDAIMFNPSAELLSRFKSLENQKLAAIRARFALVKYLNRLVTPLLHYVDIRLYESSGKLINFNELGEFRLTSQARDNHVSLAFAQTKRSSRARTASTRAGRCWRSTRSRCRTSCTSSRACTS